MEQFAVMNVEKGEEIVAALVSGHIPGTGRYKSLAKKNKKEKYEWAHFTERDNGLKENVYRGETKDTKELKQVLEIMNRNLKRIFGDKAEMKESIPEFPFIMGNKFDDTIN
ncbi:MAG: hypothetical protein ACT4OJ_04685 [Bacteroidota bacterium]